jgi:hypothetical protein
MKNLVQALMNDHPDSWLSTLESDFKISVIRDGDLASLKYNQIESPMHEPIVQQCRGMVVHTEHRRVVAWGYNKFWNLGETQAAPIDWNTARTFNKLDGSLMQLHWHEGKWRVASSGHPTAGGSFGAESRTFQEAFWQTFHALGYQLPPEELQDTTFLLELCDAPNRIVVRHEKPLLVLHGARRLTTGQEITYNELRGVASQLAWQLVEAFPLNSVEQCLEAAASLDPLQQEGFVVVDASFNRVKIKSPRYVILHHMKGDATPRRAVELWQTGETGELLVHFPEMATAILPIQEQLDSIARRAANEHDEALCRSFDRKSYASMATRYPFSAVMFRMLTDGLTGTEAAKAIMRRMSLAALERLIDVPTGDPGTVT